MWREKTSLLQEEVDTLFATKTELFGEVEGIRKESSILEEQRNELNTQVYLLEHQMNELKINTQLLQTKKDELWQVCEERQTKANNLNIEVDCLKEKQLHFEKEVASLESKRTTLLESIEETHRQIEHNVNLYYTNAMNIMQNSLDASAEKAGEEYRQAIQEYQTEYATTLGEMALAFDDEIAEKKESLTALMAELKRLQKIVNVAIEERKRAENENKDLFRLSLSEIDLKEIKHLREVIPYLREARPLNKMIWEGYYQRTYKDLVIRLIGEKRKACGIYKLTNLLDGKIYIGQARDISERWSEHIKKGLGIDTNNQILYIAMRKDGPENFTYEVLEECEPAELNDKEKFWITYFKSTEYGYNMKVG